MAGTGAVARRTYGGRSAADRRAERRERLLDAGLDLFGTSGYAAASIEKLCTHAGVSTRNFYEEFASREDLLMALHDRIVEQAFQAVVSALSEGADAPLARRFELAVRAFVTTTASDPRWARLAYVEIIGVSNTVEKHRIAWRDRWAEFLVAEAKRAVKRGEAPQRDFCLGAVALIGAVNELVHHWSVSGGQGSLDAVIAEIVRIATAAVTAP
ncbi:TetR/AcrR family transcriptional regulator [Actinophytocola xanthii]|uniref:TetR family transcriptional regulator n=1 Tax=Actinophytocola xanthii TaxID=1912961 RepID=A0A1Q8CXB4_9PSEU|nr:TetR/AcrR family transcriptional regulator [Actinophytocola xanthii]OLF18997.1 TetR family transcriptional regulator [Actinophytocola xanthii]